MLKLDRERRFEVEIEGDDAICKYNVEVEVVIVQCKRDNSVHGGPP